MCILFVCIYVCRCLCIEYTCVFYRQYSKNEMIRDLIPPTNVAKDEATAFHAGLLQFRAASWAKLPALWYVWTDFLYNHPWRDGEPCMYVCMYVCMYSPTVCMYYYDINLWVLIVSIKFIRKCPCMYVRVCIYICVYVCILVHTYCTSTHSVS